MRKHIKPGGKGISKGKFPQMRMPVGAASALVLALSGVLNVSQALAASPLPAGTLPTGGVVTSGTAGIVTAPQSLTINQQSARAIINWQTFNISPDSAVRFNHLTGATGTTLNRIFDANPSLIQGRLSANGQVYLINQNGIIFDGSAQINVGGLVASTLNISDDLYLNGILSNALPASTPVFTVFDNGQPSGVVRVESGAEIRTEREGRVMLLAPQVQNNGLISTPEGQTILAAGEKVYLTASTNPTLRGLLVEVDNGGAAENLNLGRIVAERGNITLVGLAVNQSGRVSATTTVNANGSIRLLARDTVISASQDGVNVPRGSHTGSVVFGAGSVTEVLPELANAQTSFDEQTFNRSTVEVLGKSILLQENSTIRAAGGNITLTAQAGADFQSSNTAPVDGARVYLAQGAVVDVAGTQDVAVPIERNIVEVELRGDELKDSPLQRNGFLRGKKVLVDSRKDVPTPLADVGGFTSRVPRTVAERSAEGGNIVIKSEGDVILREGSGLDVSGGGVQYQDGYLKTTKLVSEGRIYDIGSASADRVYSGFADTFVKDYGRWGVTETFQALDRGEFTAGYYEGRNAGTISINAHGVVLDGGLRGKAVPGMFQRDIAKAPLGGRLVIGDPLPTKASSADPSDFRIAGFDFSDLLSPLSAAVDFSSPLLLDQVLFPTGIVGSGGFSRLELYSNGAINLPDGVNLALSPGGSVALTGRQVNVLGNITAPSGSIALTTTDTSGSVGVAADYGITLGAGARLDASGLWTNDSPAVTATPSGPIAVNGGTVAIRSTYDANLGAGSIVNVSGGGWVQSNDKLKGGNAGSITIESGDIVIAAVPQQGEVRLGGELQGYALGKGGALSINAPEITVTGQLQGVGSGIELTPQFFQSGGFRDFTLRGRNGVTVTDNTVVAPLQQSLVPDADFHTRPSGSDILAFSTRDVLPVEQRAAQKITLNASSTQFGDLEIGEGAALRVDPGGEIKMNAGRQLTVLGKLDAPAGKITLTLPEASESNPFDATQSIWLGANSRLLARGDTKIITDNRGLRKGEILNGGSVTISAGRGYVIAEQGALIDVSGTTGVLDVNQESAVQGLAPATAPTLIASDAGSVALASREGIFFDGTLLGMPGADTARGGALSVALDYRNPLIGYPGGPREVHIAQSGNSVPAGLAPGQAVSNALNGQALITADRVQAGGFDELAVKSRERIVFDGNVNLATRRSVGLDAPVIAASPGANAGIASAYVALGNRDVDRQTLQAASGGSGADTLSVNARLIDLEGQLALQGLDALNMTASEDIRAKGALNTATGRELMGALSADGDLTFTARQVYPTTFSNFTIQTTADPGNTITFNRNGADTPVLSAAGKLTVSAPEIVQQGVIKAPFGQIALIGSESLALGSGSITSVSAEGQLIPFGKTELSGIDYVYALGLNNAVIQQGPPEKSVRLESKAVKVAAGSRIDLSGGGDTYAYEFIAGPGGSTDVLVPANAAGSFAIIPGMTAEFAPYDHQYQLDVSGLKPGDRIYLSGGNDIPAGTYTLLPARYALLPGAFLVSPKAGTTDIQASQSQNSITGTQVVSGYRVSASLDGSLIRDARTSGFEIKSGALVRNEAEYRETTAAGHFAAAANGQMPGDAGRLSVAATQSLVLDGNLVAAADAGRRGAEVDITAPKLAVVSPGGAALGGTGFVELNAASLNNLNAASLLLGGTRSTTADVISINVGSGEVVIANTAGDALTAPEILIAATDRIALLDGSKVRANGESTGTARDITIGSTAGAVNGEGALLRASTGAQVDVARENINALNPARGRLDIASGATVAGRSVILDATLSNRFSGTLALESGGALALGANRISAGDTANVVTGLAFSNAQLAALGNPTDLLLRSYSTLDLFGAAEIGNAGLANLVIESAGIGGYQNSGQSARIEAQNVTLRNPRGIAFSNAPALAGGAVPAPGNGTLQVAGQTVGLGDGTVEVRGFGNTAITAQRELLAAGAGALNTTGSLNVEASRIAAAPGADYAINVAGGTFSTALPATPAIDLPPAGLGGQLSVTAQTISHAGRFDLPSGVLELKATGAAGPDGQGSVTLATGSQINTAGRTEQFFDVGVASRGGKVALSSANANVMIAANALVDVSGADGADAGALSIRAANGAAQIDGILKGGANPAAAVPRQGEFMLDVATLADFNQLNQLLNSTLDSEGRIVSGGFTETRDIRVRSGDVNIGSAADADVTVTARRLQVAADNGDINVYGSIDASSDKGGQVALLAGRGANPNAGDVMVHSGALINARGTEAVAAPFGTRGEGGRVLLGSAASGGQVNVAAGSVIDVAGAGAARGGEVILRAQRNGAGSDVPVTALGEINGARDVIAEGYKVYTATNITGAGTNSATNFNASTTGTAFTEAQNFVNNTRGNAGGVRSRLSASAAANFHLRAGVEVQSPGDLTVSVNEATTATNQTTPALQLRGWNLGAWRFGSGTADAGFSQEPGVLTLRAAGNVNINSSIGDGFSSAAGRLMNEWNFLTADNAATPNVREDNSSSIRIAAGADLAAANPLAVNSAGTGNIALADNKLVRTGNGSIDIAAGGNLNLNGAGAVIYTAGVAGPVYADYTLVNLGLLVQAPPLIRRPQFPDHGGDLTIRVGGDVNGSASEQLFTGWLQRQGQLDSDGNIESSSQPGWWVRFDGSRLTNNSNDARYIQGGFRQGVGALGGGDVVVDAGGNINKLSVSTPTNGRLRGADGTAPDAVNLAVQGGGDIRVDSGGDILSGVFFVDRGRADITARGDIGKAADRPVSTILALGDGRMNLNAGGDIVIEGVVNPTMLTQGPRNNQNPGNFGAPVSAPQNVFFTYSADSALGITAVGDVDLTNRTDRIRSAYAPAPAQTDNQALFQGASSGEQALAVYPGTLKATALTGDINVETRFSMFPAANGNLELIANGAVTAPVLISMSDANPSNLPSPMRPGTTFNESALLLDAALGARVHSDPPLHARDTEPVRIYARTGSITGNESGTPLQLPKQARIIAGEDVRDLSLLGQNVGENDVTLIAAGRDVLYTPRTDAFGNQLAGNGAIQLGGPGQLAVIAGRNIDLSTSQGILTRGNLNNPLLPEGGASIMTLAGAPLFAQNGTPKIDAAQYLGDGTAAATLPPIRLTRTGLVDHVRRITGDTTVNESNAVEKFNALSAQQQWPLFLNGFFAALRETGRAANSNGGNYDRGFQAIESVFPAAAYKGDINLFFSQIKTEQGGDIDMLVPGGIINAGLANAGSFSKGASVLGIVTVSGGSVRAFVRDDFLVNASRVFTLGGGDILIWSSEGNIDAGKGAKTASATPPPLLKIDNQGNITLDTTQSVSGSGIGVLLAKSGITPGDVDLIAPRGEVNAGDAGIRSAGNINIAAVRVVGADNIQVGGRSTGVPTGDGGNFAGALSGAGNVGAEGNRASDAAARNAAAAAQAAQSLQDGFRPTFVSVEILGLGEGN